MAAANPLAPIPHPPKKPIVGNMLTVSSETPLQSLMQLTRENGPIFWLDMMGTPLVVASSASLIDELCDEKRFDKAVRGSLRRIRAIAGDGLFTGDTQEANWAKAHNILLPTFSQRAMVNYLPMMLDIASQLMLKWERLNADDEVDVVHDMTALALDTIGVCGFDYRFNSFYRRDYHPFIDALTRTLETCMMQRGLPFENVLLRKRLSQLKTDVDFMNKLVDDIIRERRRGGQGGDQNDLLNYMLAGVDKQTGESLSDENIRYQINTFLIAGHETTSGLLSFTLYFLLNHPDVLAKAYDEVDRVLGSDIGVLPTIAQVNQLTYVAQILKEALRLWPTAPAFGLYPYKDEVVGGQYKLKSRTFVTALTLMLHRDPAVWGDDPEAFNPDQFSREAEAERPVNAYKPFGNGQRACIGRQFAMQEAVLVIGMLLQRFQLFDHTKYQLKIKETLSIKPDGFKIKVKPRPGRTRGTTIPAAGAPATTAPAAATAARPKHGTALTVLYGSNLGATEEIARAIAESAEINGFDVNLAEMDTYAGRLPTEGAVVIACASYNGGPPDNAARFAAWLAEASDPALLAGVTYAVFGCGNRDWASTYQSVPRQIDERLAALGARRIRDRGEGDAREDLDGQFQTWFSSLFPAIGEALDIGVDFTDSPAAEPLYLVETLARPGANPIVTAAGAQAMTIAASRELQTRTGNTPSDRSTRHIEVGLPTGSTYRPGDHLSVVPVNGQGLVARAERHFGFEPNAYVRLRTHAGRRSALPVDEPLAVRQLLTELVELQAVATRKQVQAMADHTRCPMTKPKLAALASDTEPGGYRSEVWAKRKSILDLLEEFPACELGFGDYLEMLPLMAPRYYSISSSPLVAPDSCSITVGVVTGPARSGRGTYEGICSNHLDRLGEGAVIHAMIRETKAGFRLPDDPLKPIIMIGPGTGLAPFRGFLQQRARLKAQGQPIGPAVLFFGCRHPDQDFIYRDELEAFARDGIADLHVAFSRHDGSRTYVQDLVKAERDKLKAMIEAGAVIFICGDGSRMEPDVKRTLVGIYCDEKDVSLEEGEAWIDRMGRENRYVLDVWAGS
ncbi:bifunctional cytochrome P450/NADPH--P450 reductase [Phreatobacter stygius]|uniref:Bifunctional cytochrome P450/NADPH--P450 reductase n=3 Tax=Pseudomonadota TaxID=1224 RepID=A0A4D7B796_9HYPH|nr:cytochrome P450 [Phreatobacter stygius]QCI63797.1 cytochrome P450 [Phreatobacter stygius]